MKKNAFAALLLFAVVAASAFAQQHTNRAQQQITRIAVVDLTRVHAAFFPDSQRELDRRRAAVQAEINRMTQEIQGLRSAHVEAVSRGDQLEALRLQDDIRARTEFLREFHAVNTAELEAQRRAIGQTDEFLARVYREIQNVARSEGIVMVFDLNTTPGILWHSPVVDITNQVVQGLRGSR